MGEVAQKVGKARGGSQRAMRWLYVRHVDAAWKVAFRILQRNDLAQDCTQEAFVKAFARLDLLSDPERFSGWLMCIVHRKALDLLRSEAKHVAQSLTDHEATHSEFEDLLLRKRLAEAIASLDGNLMTVFISYHLLGYRHAEIARILGIAEGSSKRRLHEARQRLQAQLQDVAPQ